MGARISRSGSLDDLNSSRLRNFRLQQIIPPLLSGKEPEAGSIYDIMGIDFPAIDGGWPSESDDTDDRFFDTVTIFLAQDSIVDLSNIIQICMFSSFCLFEIFELNCKMFAKF